MVSLNVLLLMFPLSCEIFQRPEILGNYFVAQGKDEEEKGSETWDMGEIN